jgi:hypothetical protein
MEKSNLIFKILKDFPSLEIVVFKTASSNLPPFYNTKPTQKYNNIKGAA